MSQLKLDQQAQQAVVGVIKQFEKGNMFNSPPGSLGYFHSISFYGIDFNFSQVCRPYKLTPIEAFVLEQRLVLAGICNKDPSRRVWVSECVDEDYPSRVTQKIEQGEVSIIPHEQPTKPWEHQGSHYHLPEWHLNAYPTRLFPGTKTALNFRLGFTEEFEDWHFFHKFDVDNSAPELQSELQRVIQRLTHPTFQFPEQTDQLYLATLLLSSNYSDLALYAIDAMYQQCGLRYTVETIIGAYQYTFDSTLTRTDLNSRHELMTITCRKAPSKLVYRDRWHMIKRLDECMISLIAQAPEDQYQDTLKYVFDHIETISIQPLASIGFWFNAEPTLADKILHLLEQKQEFTHAASALYFIADDEQAIAYGLKNTQKFSNSDGHFIFDIPWLKTLYLLKGARLCDRLLPFMNNASVFYFVSLFNRPETIEGLGKKIVKDKTANLQLTLACHRWPLASLAGLATLISKDSKVAPLVLDRFKQLLVLYPDASTLLAGHIAPNALKQLTLHSQSETLTVATLAELPECLGAPPWLGKQKTTSLVAAYHDYPARKPKLPDFWQPEGWSRPVLHNGHVLPVEVLDHIGTMLMFPREKSTYIGLLDLKSSCTQDSLAKFAWDLFCAWLHVDAPAKSSWALSALGVFYNETVIRDLAELIKSWPSKWRVRGITGLEVLKEIANDLSLMLLVDIEKKAKSDAISGAASDILFDLAQAQGLSRADLDDQLLPSLGLAEHGYLVLDYGTRQFHAGVDSRFKVWVQEVGINKRSTTLPKANSNDNSASVEAASTQLKLFKKDLTTLVNQQVTRFEQAMIHDVRWQVPRFMTYLVKHPVIGYLVQKLVWVTYKNKTIIGSFRVADDHVLYDAQHQAITLPQGDDIRVGVMHSMDLDEATTQAFAQQFKELGIEQPFVQLGREVYTMTDDELKDGFIKRWDQRIIKKQHALSLVARGWKKDPSNWYEAFEKKLGSNLCAEIELVSKLNPQLAESLAHIAPVMKDIASYSSVDVVRVWYDESPETDDFIYPDFSMVSAKHRSEIIRDITIMFSFENYTDWETDKG